MEIRNVTAEQLEYAAHTAQVRMVQGGSWGRRHYGAMVEPVGQTRQGGRKWRLTLRTIKDEDGKVIFGRRGFTRNANGNRRRIPGCVCWHGHRAFMRALFATAPHATIITGVARYNGLEHFEQTHRMTGLRNVGGVYEPVTFADLCDCA